MDAFTQISTASAPNARVALNSYEQSIELEESKESFRFRFPA
jgi:hypothetical protein